MKIEIKCVKCGEKMKFLGNISGKVYASYPAQWDDVYICEKCKEKRTVRERGGTEPDYSFIEDYPDQSNITQKET